MSVQLREQERERYRRQMMLQGFTEEHQQRLKNSHAFIGGVGGLGGTAALYLAVAGIGKLTFVHSGKLELPDLNRQILMKHTCVGEARIGQAKKSVQDINPEVIIDTFDERISDRNVRQLLVTADIALSARPNFAERRSLNKACVEKGIPMIEAAMNGMEGYLFNVIPKATSCLHCVFPQDDPDWEELGFSVLGAVPGMLGCMMALEAIKILTGYGRPLFSQMLVMNGQELEFMKIKIPRNEHCEVCGG